MNDIFVSNEEQDVDVPLPIQKIDNDSVIYYPVDLPSVGSLGYSERMKYRDVMVKDEKLLAVATADTYQEIMDKILYSLLEDPSDYEKLSIHDRDYLLIWIWANTYTTIKEYEVSCKHCGVTGNSVVDITKLNVENLSDDYIPDFELPLSKTGEVVKLNLLTVADERKVVNYLDGLDDEGDYINTLMTQSITFEKQMTLEQKLKYVAENVKGKEMGIIRAFHKHFKFGIDNKVKYKCSQCAGVTEYEFPFSVDFFIPEVQRDFERLLSSNKKV